MSIYADQAIKQLQMDVRALREDLDALKHIREELEQLKKNPGSAKPLGLPNGKGKSS